LAVEMICVSHSESALTCERDKWGPYCYFSLSSTISQIPPPSVLYSYISMLPSFATFCSYSLHSLSSTPYPIFSSTPSTLLPPPSLSLSLASSARIPALLARHSLVHPHFSVTLIKSNLFLYNYI